LASKFRLPEKKEDRGAFMKQIRQELSKIARLVEIKKDVISLCRKFLL